MKNLLIALCLLSIAGSAIANEYYNTENYETEKTYSETLQKNSKTQNVQRNNTNDKSETYQRRLKFSGNGPSQSGSYYNFGSNANYGYRGKF